MDIVPGIEKQKTIKVKRTFNLPIDTVWKAFTEPQSCRKWSSPLDYTCPDCTIDFKVGGKYRTSMVGKDGKKIWSTDTYKEIVQLKKIVYTDSFSNSKGDIVPSSDYKIQGEWPLELMITVEFEEV